MQDLFEEKEDVEAADSAAPLATRMRPRSLEELVGQEHILAPGKLLRRAIEADRLPSVILSGPPGSGKTTLAQIIAEMTHAKFIRISGVESNVAEMRRVIAAATNRLRTSRCRSRKPSPDWRDHLQSVLLCEQRARLALAGLST